MKVYTARQAILNRRKQSVAYELFFRDGIENAFPDIDPDVATSKLMINHHFNVGFKSLTRGKKALINFSEESLIKHTPCLLPPQDIVIEVLEDTQPTEAVYQACREMFHKGYRMALDDFMYHNNWDRFLNFTRLIKFDIQNTPLDEIAPVYEELKKRKGIKFLAEKVETHEEFQQAKEMGFDFFQGYFFCKPEMIVNNDVEARHHMILAIYQLALRPVLNYSRLAQYFEQDVSLTYKLLRFINSGLFQLREPINSIKGALVYLGEDQARKFICLIATAHLGHDKPMELLRMSIIRARFCELIALKLHPEDSDKSFMVGLFSLIDALLDQDMEQILNRLPLGPDVKDALKGEVNEQYQCLQLVKAYESGSWYWSNKRANAVGIATDTLPPLYEQATRWSEVYETSTGSEGSGNTEAVDRDSF